MARQASRGDDVEVNPEMVAVARQSRGLTQSELAGRLGVTQGRLSKIESGALAPPSELVDSLSQVLDYPVEFFFQSDRVYGPSISEFFHRKRASVPVKVLDKLHAQLNIRRMHIARLMRSTDVDVSVPKFDPDEFQGDVEEIARAVRAMWQLPRGPVKNLVQTIEDAGGVVIRMPFETAKVDAVSWWTPGAPPIFAVNEGLPADRERMTLAHELGHLVMHNIVRADMEDEANRFAAAFLMPPEDVRSELRHVSLQTLAGLKGHWRVSMQALLVQAERLGTISPKQAKWIWIQLSRAGYRTREPAELDFDKEEASLLSELVGVHINDLEFDISQLAKLLNATEGELSGSYGLGPPKPVLRRIK